MIKHTEDHSLTQSHGAKGGGEGSANDLENLKQEILQRAQAKESGKKLPWGSLLVTVILAALALLSIAQTVQSATILNKVKNGDFGAAASTGSLQDLPDMVGGC